MRPVIASSGLQERCGRAGPGALIINYQVADDGQVACRQATCPSGTSPFRRGFWPEVYSASRRNTARWN